MNARGPNTFIPLHGVEVRPEGTDADHLFTTYHSSHPSLHNDMAYVR